MTAKHNSFAGDRLLKIAQNNNLEAHTDLEVMWN